jgi:hypothetical protein
MQTSSGFCDTSVPNSGHTFKIFYTPLNLLPSGFSDNYVNKLPLKPLPSHLTYTHTPKPNKPFDPQLATSQQLKVHATHTKNC